MKMPRIHNINYTALASALLLAIALCVPNSKAADVSATASLSDDTTEAGQPVDLTIQVTGALNANMPATIDANGLSITHTGGPNINVQWVNGNMSQSVSHTYSVQSDHSGKFTIPPVTVGINGTNLTTNPVTLTVTAATGGSSSNGNTATAPSADAQPKFAFAELVLPKQTAYVGEAIPLEIRVYFDQRGRFSQLNMPDLKCEGFTMQPLTQPRQRQIEKDGRNYDMLSFKTAITPVKSGKLALGPAQMECAAQLPQQQRPQRRHTGGIDDFFNNDLFNQMMAISPPQPLAVTSDTVDFEVKPLPLADQPKNFNGAVGQFTLSTDAVPLKLNVGDPITLKMTISGRGNFDRVTAPGMVQESGWRSYAPSGKFKADDDIGISGSKTFEMAVIPDEKKTRLPQVEFAYFDPVSEKYATLEGDRLPITVEGAPVQPAPIAQSTVANPPSSAPEPAKKTSDIQYIMTGSARWGASFTPLFQQRVFWDAQAVPALALLAFAGVQIRRKKARDLLAQQLAAWRREQQELMRTLQRGDGDEARFYEAATRYIQIAAARTLHQSPGSIGAFEAIASHELDAGTSEGVKSIFNAHGELRYAGVAPGARKIDAPQRQEVLETLRRFEDASE